MFNDYRSIFKQRGEWYHSAMCSVPDARRREFEIALEMADVEPGQLILDVPSGGGYLSRFINDSVQLISVETSEIFLRQAGSTGAGRTILCEKTSAIDFPSEAADRVISIAGLHHEDDQAGFYRETHRVLKRGGRLCVADVRLGSPIDDFLDVFVNRHNSLGHRGKFLGSHTRNALGSSGFQILSAQPRSYEWIFKDVAEMASYCRKLFGLDRATPEEIVAGIDRYLGYVDDGDCCRMEWELYFLVGVKPAMSHQEYAEAS